MQRYLIRDRAHLYVDDDPAHQGSEDPGVGDVPDDGGWGAEEHDQDVGQGQVHDEDVRHGLHRLGRRHRDEDLDS